MEAAEVAEAEEVLLLSLTHFEFGLRFRLVVAVVAVAVAEFVAADVATRKLWLKCP